jgi:hypothetical protein
MYLVALLSSVCFDLSISILRLLFFSHFFLLSFVQFAFDPAPTMTDQSSQISLSKQRQYQKKERTLARKQNLKQREARLAEDVGGDALPHEEDLSGSNDHSHEEV